MNHYSHRRQRPAALSVLLSLLLLLTLLFSAAPAAATGEGPVGAPNDELNTADIVVDLGDGRTIVRRVAFPEATISGLQALQRSGLNLTTADFSFGTAVCAIEGVGCPATNCFCNATTFWGYQFWDGDDWQGYMVGASASTISDGAVEGWAWGRGGSGPPPITPAILSASAALQWMRPQQSANGSFGNNVGGTVDVILAAAAA